jgi:methylthioribulose-1-phosphate dehydratase
MPRTAHRTVDTAPRTTLTTAARQLVAVGQRFYTRGWVLGTSGNFSAVIRRDPLRLAITPSTAHKGALRTHHILEIDGGGRVLNRAKGQPSAETAIHLAIVRQRGAGAVLHTHSVWSTILSGLHAPQGGFAIEGFEMLKGLDGIGTHEHREWIPIVTNDQDLPRLAATVSRTLAEAPEAHAVLLHHHGLYTWGSTLAIAERHVEILEFLFETIGRTSTHDLRR